MFLGLLEICHHLGGDVTNVRNRQWIEQKARGAFEEVGIEFNW